MRYGQTTARRYEFRPNDPVVVLLDGRYNGINGDFVGLRADPNWADIQEQDGMVRSHPVLWLRHPQDLPDLGSSPN